MEELVKTAKQCLSIVESATAKDKEIKMWIKASILDMERIGINTTNYLENDLIRSAIIMYVKSNFGNTDIKEKELAKRAYNSLCQNLSLSTEYKEVDNNARCKL